MAIMNLNDLLDLTINELLCDGNTPKFTFLQNQNINMFEVIIRGLGGLVSAYHFILNSEHRECIKTIAIELGENIYLTTFDNTNKDNSAQISDLPWIIINIFDKTVVRDDVTSLAPAGLASNIIEFAALSHITNDSKYYIAAKNTDFSFFI